MLKIIHFKTGRLKIIYSCICIKGATLCTVWHKNIWFTKYSIMILQIKHVSQLSGIQSKFMAKITQLQNHLSVQLKRQFTSSILLSHTAFHVSYTISEILGGKNQNLCVNGMQYRMLTSRYNVPDPGEGMGGRENHL